MLCSGPPLCSDGPVNDQQSEQVKPMNPHTKSEESAYLGFLVEVVPSGWLGLM